MKNEMEVKSHVLEMLKELLMGNEGGKFKPKLMSVEVITGKPKNDKEGLDDVLQEASEAHPVEEEMHDEPDGDECYDDEKPKMSLKEFLKSRK
jgi:hypothetical protein